MPGSILTDGLTDVLIDVLTDVLTDVLIDVPGGIHQRQTFPGPPRQEACFEQKNTPLPY